MTKSTICLGVPAMPSVLDNLGLVPGVIGLCFVGFVTWRSTRTTGPFKMNHPQVYAIGDAGDVLICSRDIRGGILHLQVSRSVQVEGVY